MVVNISAYLLVIMAQVRGAKKKKMPRNAQLSAHAKCQGHGHATRTSDKFPTRVFTQRSLL